jgi:hypothetical protein
VTFTAGGAAITDNSIDYVNINGNTWTASYTTHASDTEGAVAFSIAFTNKAGIAGTADTDVDGSSSVFYDETAPTLTTDTIASAKIDASAGSIGTHANPGDEVIVTLVASEAISQPVVSFESGPDAPDDATITYTNASGDKINWTAKYTAHADDTEGDITFAVSFVDVAGVVGTPISAVTTGGGSVKFDKTDPTLPTVTIASNNNAIISGLPTNLANTDDTVTLTLVSDEEIQEPVVVFNSGASAITNSGSNITYTNATGNKKNWTAHYTPHTNDTDGDVTFTVDFKDLAGNSGGQVASLTGGDSVEFDDTAPTLSVGSIISSNPTNTLAKKNELITLTFTANTAIHTPVVTFQTNNTALVGGRTVFYENTNSPNKTEWTAKYTTSENDNNGDVSYTIQYQDLATNTGTNVTGGGTIRFDKTLPTRNTATISSNNSPAAVAKAGSEVTLSFTSSETIQTPSGNDVVFKSGGAALYNDGRVITYAGSGNTWTAKYTTHANDTDGNVTFTIDFDDLAGNNIGVVSNAVTSGGNITFDDTKPTITGTAINSANSLVTVTFAEDVYNATGAPVSWKLAILRFQFLEVWQQSVLQLQLQFPKRPKRVGYWASTRQA